MLTPRLLGFNTPKLEITRMPGEPVRVEFMLMDIAKQRKHEIPAVKSSMRSCPNRG